MFRNINTQKSVAALTLSALALVFASGCVNEVTGPTAASAPAGNPPISWTPEQSAAKAGIAPTPSTVPGDINGDGYVDASDLAAFAFLMRADLNRDERIDTTDHVIMAAVLNGQVADIAQPLGVLDASDFAAFAAARSRADLTLDGHVDTSDLVFLAWMQARGDVDGDGVVTRRDRNVIAPEVTP